MNKQELIDKAVEDLKGVWPSTGTGWIGITLSNRLIDLRDQEQPFCTEAEFTKRASELGWINGYKYGVEYTTNGKKPDLPDDVLVEVLTQNDGWIKCKVHQWFSFSYLILSKNTKFCIVDERYKPVEVEQVQADKPKKDLSDAIFAMLDAVDVLIDTGETEYAKQLKDAVVVMQAKQRQKLADEEKRAFVEAVLPHVHSVDTIKISTGNSIAEALYDAGCRFTENKGD